LLFKLIKEEEAIQYFDFVLIRQSGWGKRLSSEQPMKGRNMTFRQLVSENHAFYLLQLTNPCGNRNRSVNSALGGFGAGLFLGSLLNPCGR
jgi:hypothetical protein